MPRIHFCGGSDGVVVEQEISTAVKEKEWPSWPIRSQIDRELASDASLLSLSSLKNLKARGRENND